MEAKKLEWFVYCESFNRGRIERHNVFNHYSVIKDLQKALKKYRDNRPAFLEEAKHIFMYHYWSKCEWEIILSAWPPSKKCKEEKIDVFDQLQLNWDAFCDYLWENRALLKKIKLE